jgi:hypothetical protein
VTTRIPHGPNPVLNASAGSRNASHSCTRDRSQGCTSTRYRQDSA